MNEGPRGESKLYEIGNDIGEMKGSLKMLVESLQGPNGLAVSFSAHVEKTDARFASLGERVTRLETKVSGFTKDKAKRYARNTVLYGGLATLTVKVLIWLATNHWPAIP